MSDVIKFKVVRPEAKVSNATTKFIVNDKGKMISHNGSLVVPKTK